MTAIIKVGIIGDYDSLKNSHPAANAALQHSAAALGAKVDFDWLPTAEFLAPRVLEKLSGYDCLWASSGDPKSTQGMLNAIQWARQSGQPFIST